MQKSYFFILEKHSHDPIEIRQTDTSSEEKCTIDFEETDEGQFLARLSAPNMLTALKRALEIRDNAVANGEWDIIGKNHRNSI